MTVLGTQARKEIGPSTPFYCLIVWESFRTRSVRSTTSDMYSVAASTVADWPWSGQR